MRYCSWENKSPAEGEEALKNLRCPRCNQPLRPAKLLFRFTVQPQNQFVPIDIPELYLRNNTPTTTMQFKYLLLAASPVLAAVHTVDVGEKGLTFNPKTITAVEGDLVIFHLFPVHDVAQGAFDSPCIPSDTGFYSGTYSNSDNGKKKFVVNVTSSDPIYFYCAVQRHCQNGMVGGINLPSSGDTVDAYASAAAEAEVARAPAQVRGGQLLEDAAVASLTAAAGPSSSPNSSPKSTPSSSPTGSSVPSGSSAPTTTPPASSSTPSGSVTPAASSTPGAANAITAGELSGFAAMVLGVVAWVL
ncbi:hypothetical protein P154DRAFT_524714 [Amniculicola lignicola CBS 123094]|uniref:Cupredoxin n=1 Tax=Amniculicola lignicola CBS 123094 TaxID=1392246 RepID=A0A6A5W6J1_9PLEO|nr:hypothetical protein P154DRAFT_524714 [Amniculicola lignicola CBS 123094]